MAITEVISILFGAGGLGIGAYSYYKQRGNRQKKEKLKDLSDELNSLRRRVEQLHEGLAKPMSNEDLASQLDLLAKDILAFKHSTDDNPVLDLYFPMDDGALMNEQQALNVYKNDYDWVQFYAEIDSSGYDYDSRHHYTVYDGIFLTAGAYRILDTIREHYKSILEDFDPDLYDSIETALDSVIKGIYSKVIRNTDGLQVNPDEYDNVAELSENVYEAFVWYDEIEQDLQELENLIGQIEDVRTAILQASYT